MSDGGRAGEVTIREAAVDEQVAGGGALFAGVALEERNAESVKVAGGDPAIVGQDFPVRVEAAVELEFDLILEGDAREGAGGSGGFDAGHSTEGVEGAVDAADESRHVRGFSPGAADLKGEDVGGVESWGDAVELLEAAEE
jgi:hypothetical protein